MALPGDARLVIDVPPVANGRRGTITMGWLNDECELDKSQVYLLTPAEELEVAQLVRRKVRGSCGPSFF